MYSDSAEDKATTVWWALFQLTGELLTVMTKPVVELLDSFQLAQFESDKASNPVFLFDL